MKNLKRSAFVLSILIALLAFLVGHIRGFIFHAIAMLPMILLLNFGMGIQISRDYGLFILIGFVASQVFYAIIYSRYIDNPIKKEV